MAESYIPKLASNQAKSLLRQQNLLNALVSGAYWALSTDKQ
jgi:hypothetical protein